MLIGCWIYTSEYRICDLRMCIETPFVLISLYHCHFVSIISFISVYASVTVWKFVLKFSNVTVRYFLVVIVEVCLLLCCFLWDGGWVQKLVNNFVSFVALITSFLQTVRSRNCAPFVTLINPFLQTVRSRNFVSFVTLNNPYFADG